MIVSVVNSDVVVKFPLSQPKRAWKVRRVLPSTTPKRGSRVVVSVDTFFNKGYAVEPADQFEWMVSNGEVRDILAALKEVAPEAYEEICSAFKRVEPKVDKPADFKQSHETTRDIGKVRVESQLRTTQRGESPQPFPYLFVLFQLGEPTDEYYIADRRGHLVAKPIGRPLRSGDRLVWKPAKEVMQAIVEALAALSREHKERLKRAATF